MPERILSYAAAVREALFQAMELDPGVIVIGEGVPDPKRIFATTDGLLEAYGPDRVLDMPLSENGMTGVCIGLALAGFRPVLVHQRIDFALLAMDQIVNHAAKWRFLFGADACVPIVVRALVGRGWGQGPQHAQSLQVLFGHIPGLRVVMPGTAREAKGMLMEAVASRDPVVFIEHRWLHGTFSEVPEEAYRLPLSGAAIAVEGTDITIVAVSHMMVEARKAVDWLRQRGVSAELVDLRAVRPLDTATVLSSVEKTGRLLVLDTGWKTYGIAAEIITQIIEGGMSLLRAPPARIALPDLPAPTSHYLTDQYYPDAADIAAKVLSILGKVTNSEQAVHDAAVLHRYPMDVPDHTFLGPF